MQVRTQFRGISALTKSLRSKTLSSQSYQRSQFTFFNLLHDKQIIVTY